MLRCPKLLLVLAFAAVAVAAEGDDVAVPNGQIASKEATREFTETYLRALAYGTTSDAFAMIKAAAPGSEVEIDSVRQSTERLIEQVRPTYGKPVGHEVLDQKSLGQSLIRYECLLKFERNALHCRMIYYRANNAWAPVGIWFNDDLRQLFEDLGK